MLKELWSSFVDGAAQRMTERLGMGTVLGVEVEIGVEIFIIDFKCNDYLPWLSAKYNTKKKGTEHRVIWG